MALGEPTETTFYKPFVNNQSTVIWLQTNIILLSQASLGSEVYLETIRTFAMDVKVY